jgi:hypothetical protein
MIYTSLYKLYMRAGGEIKIFDLIWFDLIINWYRYKFMEYPDETSNFDFHRGLSQDDVCEQLMFGWPVFELPTIAVALFFGDCDITEVGSSRQKVIRVAAVKRNLIFTLLVYRIVVMGSYQCCGSGSGSVGSWSLLVRSRSLKELWMFAVLFSSSE